MYGVFFDDELINVNTLGFNVRKEKAWFTHIALFLNKIGLKVIIPYREILRVGYERIPVLEKHQTFADDILRNIQTILYPTRNDALDHYYEAETHLNNTLKELSDPKLVDDVKRFKSMLRVEPLKAVNPHLQERLERLDSSPHHNMSED